MIINDKYVEKAKKFLEEKVAVQFDDTIIIKTIGITPTVPGHIVDIGKTRNSKYKEHAQYECVKIATELNKRYLILLYDNEISYSNNYVARYYQTVFHELIEVVFMKKKLPRDDDGLANMFADVVSITFLKDFYPKSSFVGEIDKDLTHACRHVQYMYEPYRLWKKIIKNGKN